MSQPSIFISYSHSDGTTLAIRLHRDLRSLALDPWLDTTRLQGGDRWTNEIESALDDADIVLALISKGSFMSDVCRAEQIWAADAGKHIIPIRVQRDARANLRISHLQFVDFSDQATYAQSFEALRSAIHAASVATAALTTLPLTEPRYNNTPGLPNNFVPRPEPLTRLRNALFLEPRRSPIVAHF